MYTQTCQLDERTGLAWIEQQEDFAVIANKALYKKDNANRFAIVNTVEKWVDSVHTSQSAANTALATLDGSQA
jgi:hypothetical protein